MGPEDRSYKDARAPFRSQDAQISAKIAQALEPLDNQDLANIVKIARERPDTVDNIILIARERQSTIKMIIQMGRDRENADAGQQIQWAWYSKILAIGAVLIALGGLITGIVTIYLQFFRGKP